MHLLIQVLDRLLDVLLRAGHKVLVFTRRLEVLRLLMVFCERRGR